MVTTEHLCLRLTDPMHDALIDLYFLRLSSGVSLAEGQDYAACDDLTPDDAVRRVINE